MSRRRKNKDTVADYLNVLSRVQRKEAEEIVDEIIANTYAHYEPKVHMREVLVHMAMGKTVLETAYDMGYSVLTLNLWRRDHEDFDMIVNIGKALAEAWWQKQGRENIRNPYFNQALWMMNMSNRYSWSRKVDGIIKTVIDDEMERYDTKKGKGKETYQGNINSEEVIDILQIIQESRNTTNEIQVYNQDQEVPAGKTTKSKSVLGAKIKVDKLHPRRKRANAKTKGFPPTK